jgi:malonate transporter
MSRFLRSATRSLSSFLGFVVDVMGDGLRFLRLAIRSHSTLSAEILFLRKQLAFYEERHVQPHRLEDSDRTAETRTRARRGTVGLVALGINLVVPAAIILLEMGSSGGAAPAASSSRRAQVLSGLKSGLRSPLLWGPVLGIVVVLAGLRIPKDIASCFQMIGSATSGVAVFTVGLTLAAQAFHLSKAVLLGTLGRVTVQTAVLFALLHLLHVQSPFAREALVCCSFPLATIVVLLAAKYKTMEAESASALLLSTLSLVVTVPIIIALSR